MKNVFLKTFLALSTVIIFTGCSDDKADQVPGPGAPGGPAQPAGFAFQTVKFGYDYVGTAPVLIGSDWTNLEFREQIVEDVINKHNLPESHDVALECAGSDGSGKRPDVASFRVWFEKVCERVEGYYDIAIYFVRMFVEIEIPGECGAGTSIVETYDFWENATALNSHPDNMIPNGSRQIVRVGEEIPFDPLNVDLKILDGDTLQGKLGTQILPNSQYDVKLHRQLQYIGGRGEEMTAERCNEVGAATQAPNTPVVQEDHCEDVKVKEPVEEVRPNESEDSTSSERATHECRASSVNNTMDPQKRGYIGTQKPGSDPISKIFHAAGEVVIDIFGGNNNRSDQASERVSTPSRNSNGLIPAQSHSRNVSTLTLGNYFGTLGGYVREPNAANIESRTIYTNLSPVRGNEERESWLSIFLPDHNSKIVFKLVRGSSGEWGSIGLNPDDFEAGIHPNNRRENLSTADPLYYFFHGSSNSFDEPVVKISSFSSNGTITGNLIVDRGIDMTTGRALGYISLPLKLHINK